MDVASLGIGLTPHCHLFLTHDADAPRLDERLHDRLRRAFERGPGHVLLLLGADEVGTVLPPVHSYWREFGARYVTALCTQQASPIAAPASDEKHWEQLPDPRAKYGRSFRRSHSPFRCPR